ncbi:MAG: DUF4037 domain-containing protein [Methanobacteriota archaeon]
MPRFVKGMVLSERFFREVVESIVHDKHPGLKYSAGLLGYGSEVLGLDSARSTDHEWGPCVQLFLEPADFGKRNRILRTLAEKLPPEFMGFCTNFERDAPGESRVAKRSGKGAPINHKVEVHTAASFFKDYMGLDIKRKMRPIDWLTTSEQKLATVRAGTLFRDDLDMERLREKLRYYPRDIWLYLLASEWAKLGQEEPFVGRCGEAGDDMGSRLVAARLVHTVMRLCFLMEREYAPYSKWFGTAFSKLECARVIAPSLNGALSAGDWKTREENLSMAYEFVAAKHNEQGITKPLDSKVSQFHDRPYLVIHGDSFASEIRKKIRDPVVKRLPPNLGSVNQFSSTVDLLDDDRLLRRLECLYSPLEASNTERVFFPSTPSGQPFSSSGAVSARRRSESP